MPNSDSEFDWRVVVAHTSGETPDTSLALQSTPRDGGLIQRVECITLERAFTRVAGREDNHHRLVRHAPTLMPAA